MAMDKDNLYMYFHHKQLFCLPHEISFIISRWSFLRHVSCCWMLCRAFKQVTKDKLTYVLWRFHNETFEIYSKRSKFYYEQSRYIMKGRDFTMNGQDVLWEVEIVLWTLEIFMMTGRVFMMTGRDFHDSRSRFPWWTVEIFMTRLS